MKTLVRLMVLVVFFVMVFAFNLAEANVLCANLPQMELVSLEVMEDNIRPEPLLSILHITHEEFNYSIANPRPYNIDGFIRAGIVPHHLTASTMISGFFAQASAFADYYDLVIILAPNHEADVANVVLSYRDWGIGEGVLTHRGFVDSLMAEIGIDVAICHSRVELDHSASILIPYIYHYLPNTKVAPVLLSRFLSFDGTVNLFRWLMNWIEEADESVLLVASIDFSHFLTPTEAFQRDMVTMNAIINRDFRLIHYLNYHYLDSAASLIIFLKYLDELGIPLQIIDHADASEFLGMFIDETTTYKIIVGVVPEPTQVRLTFVGDIMLHEPQMNVDFNHTFSRVSPHLQSADLAIGNLETVLGGFFSDFPLFSAPDEFGIAIRNAGFDILSTANNHSLDQGVDGLLRSLDFLESIGIDTFGTYRSREERDTVLIREVEGIRFAFLSYTFGTNGQPIPTGRDYLVNLMNENLIRADIAKARELADFVIVMPHMGNEYELFVRQEFKDWAMMMLEAGADIVVAGHPHVVQPMGFVQIINHESGEARRGFVAYCLGNFVSSQRIIPTETGVMLNLYFERTGTEPPTFTGASYIPTWVKFADASGNPDIIILPISETLRAIDAGESLNIRQADISRMRDARREISEIILGQYISLVNMQDRYFIP